MIIGMVGRMGTGKTLSAIRYLYHYYKNGYTIYSNIKLNFPHTHIGLNDLILYSNANTYLDKSIIFLDEAHTFLDSRNGMSKKNRLLTYFIVLTRKMGCHLIYTTQRYHQIDKRLRDNTDVIIQCTTKATPDKTKYTHNYIMIMLEAGYKVKQDIFKSSDYYNFYNTRELVRIE